jgi:hypothetical protein
MDLSITSFWDMLPENERIIVDYLRRLTLKTLPVNCKEQLTNGVPYYFLNKRICMIWPASIKGGGVKNGVLYGFSYGNRLADYDNYLTHGTNKRIFYKIYHSLEEIDEDMLIKLLHEAIEVDSRKINFPNKKYHL